MVYTHRRRGRASRAQRLSCLHVLLQAVIRRLVAISVSIDSDQFSAARHVRATVAITLKYIELRPLYTTLSWLSRTSTKMAYSELVLDLLGLKAADIFRKEWRLLAFARAVTVILYFWPIAWLTLLPLYLLWKIGGMHLLVFVNRHISAGLFWYLHLFFTSMDTFEINYRQSWKDALDATKDGDSEVVMLNIFVGNESMAVPLLYNQVDPTMNSDAETFKQLCMWYSWMQYKRGFGELVLPRWLARIDKVKVGIS